MVKKMSTTLYDLTRKVGKVASTINDLENLGKSIKTGNPSYITKRIIRKNITKNANKITKDINKYLK